MYPPPPQSFRELWDVDATCTMKGGRPGESHHPLVCSLERRTKSSPPPLPSSRSRSQVALPLGVVYVSSGPAVPQIQGPNLIFSNLGPVSLTSSYAFTITCEVQLTSKAPAMVINALAYNGAYLGSAPPSPQVTASTVTSTYQFSVSVSLHKACWNPSCSRRLA